MSKTTFKFNAKKNIFVIDSDDKKLTLKNIKIGRVNVSFPEKLDNSNILNFCYTLTLENKSINDIASYEIDISDSFTFFYEYIRRVFSQNSLKVTGFESNMSDRNTTYQSTHYFSNKKSARIRKIYDVADIDVFQDGFKEKATLKFCAVDGTTLPSPDIFPVHFEDLTVNDMISFYKELCKLYGYLIQKESAYLDNLLKFKKNNKHSVKRNARNLLECVSFEKDLLGNKKKIKTYFKEKQLCDVEIIAKDCINSLENVRILSINKDSITLATTHSLDVTKVSLEDIYEIKNCQKD